MGGTKIKNEPWAFLLLDNKFSDFDYSKLKVFFPSPQHLRPRPPLLSTGLLGPRPLLLRLPEEFRRRRRPGQAQGDRAQTAERGGHQVRSFRI